MAIEYNEGLRDQFQAFYERADTFSLIVCNGCQLLALLGWVPWPGIADVEQPRFIQNASGRFEPRFAAVTIEKSPAVMLKGMEGSTLGIWVAHGEGRAYFPEPSILERVERESLAPIRFVDDQGQAEFWQAWGLSARARFCLSCCVIASDIDEHTERPVNRIGILKDGCNILI